MLNTAEVLGMDIGPTLSMGAFIGICHDLHKLHMQPELKTVAPAIHCKKSKAGKGLKLHDAVIAIDLAVRDARFSISRRQQTAASVAKPHRRGSSLHRCYQSQSQFLPKVKLRTINQLDLVQN